MQIDLSIEQADLLLDILAQRKHSLTLEISHTSRRDFRQVLLHQELVLDSLRESVTNAKANVLQECP